MRILIDLQGAQSKSRFRGIGRYSLALTKAIVRNRGEHEIFIAMSALFPETLQELRDTFAPLLPAHHLVIFDLPSAVDELPEENHWRVYAAEAVREKFIRDCAPDMVLVTSLFEGSSDNTVTSIKSVFSDVPTAVILYDLIPLLNPERYIAWGPLKRWYYRKLDSLKRADLLLGISESASSEGREHLAVPEERIVTISSAADEMFETLRLSESEVKVTLERFGIKRRYVMHSSAFEPRKNFEGLIEAFAKLPRTLRADYQLVLVCKLNDAGHSALTKLAQDCGLSRDEYVLTGYVTDEELVALYRGAYLFVFPSLHEGFGLPILEAMWCGTPAIGSNTSSIPEVIGRSDALFDPTSVRAIAETIEKALADETFYASLLHHASQQCRRFSWDASAQAAIRAFETFHMLHPKTPMEDNGYRMLIDAIASIDIQPSNPDLVATAIAIGNNEKRVARIRLYDQKTPPMTWRIEGPFDSSYSLALLNRETARALEELGHTVVLHSTEGPGDFPPNPLFLSSNQDLARMHARVPDFPHERVDVASRNLYPPRVADMNAPINLLHHYAWEESGFPSAWVDEFNASLSGLSTLSTHVEKILIDAGVCVPMLTSGCGVDHWERIKSEPYPLTEAKTFRFLHVSSCFPRKGVEDLLEAYGRAFTLDDDVTLVIKTFKNPHNQIHDWLASVTKRYPRYPHLILIEDDVSDERLKGLYEQCHALVSPSRAEGYGLPMAEAMLSGLVVVTTGWGGQLDFCTPQNSFLIDFTFEQAQSHFNLFGSVWAKVDIEDLARTMKKITQIPSETLREYADLGRKELLDNHTWGAAASRLAAFAQNFAHPLEAESVKNDPRISWISTYNTKCGIATYSEHLIHAMEGAEITILAPFASETLREDSPNVIRCWNSAKEQNRFDTLSKAIEQSAAEVLIIQFNYGFFNFADFSRFLHTQVDNGQTVIVMMHATTDPFGDTPNWCLSEIIPALQRVDRVLVHSIPDLNRLKHYGLISNVALFPHGVLTPAMSPMQPHDVPLIATYGFCLPHKGLPELLKALRILRDSGRAVRLRFVTAEYPDPVSTQLVEQLRRTIVELELSDDVELHTDFLSDEESLNLLSPAELLVFAYQHTGESASGAVRYGFATGRPVAVTPLSIFDDVRVAAHLLDGTSPEQIASGLASALDAIRTDAPSAREIAARADGWRQAHAYTTLASRLYRIALALRRRR